MSVRVHGGGGGGKGIMVRTPGRKERERAPVSFAHKSLCICKQGRGRSSMSIKMHPCTQQAWSCTNMQCWGEGSSISHVCTSTLILDTRASCRPGLAEKKPVTTHRAYTAGAHGRNRCPQHHADTRSHTWGMDWLVSYYVHEL